MDKEYKTFAFTTMGMQANDPLIKGDEKYKVIGKAVSKDDIAYIQGCLAGLRLHWNCLEKAVITCEILGDGIIEVGTMHVYSSDNKSTYGFDYHPPFEFHAWVRLRKKIIVDMGLPGVIDKGLQLKDSKGYALYGRKPVILAGLPPYWLKYEPKESMTYEEYHEEKKNYLEGGTRRSYTTTSTSNSNRQ